MKVLIIQENGRHDENRKFRECYSLQKNFIKLGHDAVVWGLGHDNYNTLIDYNDYDLLINLENYDGIGWMPDVSTAECKKFLWSIDAHCRGTQVFDNEFERGRYDLLLHSTKDYVVGNNRVWFPNAYDSDLITPQYEYKDKKHFVGFCGNYIDDRKDFYEYVNQHHNISIDIWKLGEAMVDTISSYKIHLNKNLSTDINYRSFETLGCGTVLMTNSNYQYDELGFIDGKNCILYDRNNKKTILEKLDYYSNNPDELETICNEGIELVKKHTYFERVKILLDLYTKIVVT